MSKNEIGQDSPIPKFIYLKIRRRDGIESLTILEEGEFKVPIDGCIKVTKGGSYWPNICFSCILQSILCWKLASLLWLDLQMSNM